MPPRIELQPDNSILLWIKAVPGASRDQVSGVLGDRLKIRVSAPPENGKANRAICELLARTLRLKPRNITVHAGHASAEKTVCITGLTLDEFAQRLGA
jgi:uncharacterized protein (TIGR00251 family)